MIVRRWKLWLPLLGIGLALLIGFVLLRLLPAQSVSSKCELYPGSWRSVVIALVKTYHEPCTEFHYRSPADTGSEFDVQVKYNNFGLHAPDYTLEKPPGVFRIVVVGDSFPQAVQVEIEQAFPQLIQQQLNGTSAQKIEVINLSVDAYGTDRELLLYAALGWQFQPDLVLLSLFTGNDIQDNEINLERRRYGYPTDRPFFTLQQGQGTQLLQLHNSLVFDAALYPDSPVFSWLRDLQMHQSSTPVDDPPEHPLVVSPAPNYELEYPVELGVFLPDDAHWARAWALTEALILQFRDLVKMQGIPFAAFIIPDRRAVHAEDWSATLAAYGDTLPALRQADPTAPGTRLADFLAANAIPALDLTWELRAWAQSKPGQRLYLPDNGHFNPNGHAVTAARLAGWLREANLVP
jgi:lysophospholipase L1-like esterase